MSPEDFNAVFRALLPEVSKYLARRVNQVDVEDLASDLFELAWSKRNQIEKGYELPWLYKSARYLIANHHRKQTGRNRILLSLAEPVSAPSAESLALADIELSDAWGQLTAKDRELLSLWAFENLAASQIAKVLSITENATHIRLSRAKQKLIALLSENN